MRALARPLAAFAAAVACLWILGVLAPRAAEARKRLVVLEFTGPKAEDFREDVEKLLKKSHSIVPLAKWQDAADDLNATRINEKDIKKVAKKLSIDGVIAGKVEKRGSRYLVHLTLRDGTTGKTVAAPDLVERSAKLGTDGKDTIKQELLPAIDDLAAAGDDEEEEEEEDEGEDEDRPRMGKGKAKAKGKAKPRDDEDEEEASDEEEEEEDEDRTARAKAKAKAKGKAKAKPRDDDEDEEEADGPGFGKPKGNAGKGKAKPREDEDEGEDEDTGDDDRVASGDDEDDNPIDDEDAGIEDDVDLGGARDPRIRPIDITVGMSFTGRRLAFQTNLTANAPQGYRGNKPLPGVYLAIDAFPLAMNRKNRSFTRNLGVQVVFDRVISINSSLKKMDVVYDLPTTQQHLAAGVVYRHLLGAKMELDVSVRFNKRTFRIDKNNPELMPGDVDIPNTDYSYVDPGLAVGYVLSPKMMVGGGARFLFVTSTGQMQQTDQYGASTVLGVDLDIGLDYKIMSKVLIRAGARVTTLGFTFKGDGALTTDRDMDPADQDVAGARDTYFGGLVTGVYLF